MLRDLQAARDDQAEAALDIIAAAQADVILLGDVDWDFEGRGLEALVARLAEHGLDYAYSWAPKPVSGLASGLDLDGDGRLGGPRDSLGYGWFTGDSGVAVLSRHPIGSATDLSDLLWSDRADVEGLLPDDAKDVVPLATVGQWVVPLQVQGTEVSLITLAAGTPVFDGPEDRNGRRNAAELALVSELVAQADLPIVLGRANVDPVDGKGDQAALEAVLLHPALTDPRPRGSGGGGDGHLGDPALDTVNWQGPGALRVDYVLPARTMRVLDAGVIWPDADDPLAEVAELAGPARLVWVDVALP